MAQAGLSHGSRTHRRVSGCRSRQSGRTAREGTLTCCSQITYARADEAQDLGHPLPAAHCLPGAPEARAWKGLNAQTPDKMRPGENT